MWEIIPTSTGVHVIPQNDEGGHLLESECPCHPRQERVTNGNLVIIHDAYDGRLAVEWAIEILASH